MFFPERITRIKPTDRVLEVGPGGTPHPRSDILLERRFDSNEQALIQRGYAPELTTTKPIHYYDGVRFPFEDKEFDYVICSHVIEHIPVEEMPNFIAELTRVAGRGYIEFPTGLYELINQQDVHRWYMNWDGESIIALAKSRVVYPTVGRVLRAMFYANGKVFSPVFTAYRQLFFCGFEWEGGLSIKEVSRWDDLYSSNDMYALAQQVELGGECAILNFGKEEERGCTRRRIIGRIRERLHKLIDLVTGNTRPHNKPVIHSTARLNKKKLIELHDGVEIKAGVIIDTHHNSVKIGRNSQINPYTVIYGGSGVNIGENVMIAPHCMIAAGNHDYRQLEVPMRFAGTLTRGAINIEDDVWIGANCTIADGVRIGTGAVVAANTLVNRDVAPYDIVMGVPARLIGNRKTEK